MSSFNVPADDRLDDEIERNVTRALAEDVGPGDLIAVPAAGAYSRSMASNYNHVPRPPVVAVRDGHLSTLLRRETMDDLLALDPGA